MRLFASFCERAHFYLLKKFFEKISENVGVFSKRGMPREKGEAPPTFNAKGGENVEPERREFYKRCSFQKYCNTVLHNEACDAHKELRKHKAKEVTFSDLTF